MPRENDGKWSHDQLQRLALIKLHYLDCCVIYPEVYAGPVLGRLDAVGIRMGAKKLWSIGIEVKATRSDYFSAKQKFVAKKAALYPREELGVNKRFFLVPAGVIDIDELYPGWGLFEFNGRAIRQVIDSPEYDVDNTIVAFHAAKMPHVQFHVRSGLMEEWGEWKTYGDLIR